MVTGWQIVLWTSLALVAYAYVGYAIVIFCCSRLFGRLPQPPGTVGQALPEEGGLAAAPHADDGKRLAFDGGQVDVAAGVCRDGRIQRIGDLLPGDLLKFSFHKRRV